MKIIVNNANILIDLIKLRLLRHFFALEFQFHVTDMVLGELITSQAEALAPYIDKGKLQVYEVTSEDLGTITKLTNQFPRLSIKDCSALHHATKLNALLIASDNQLRITALSIYLEVHGHLWVFNCMVEANTITGTRACENLSELCDIINPKWDCPRLKVPGESNFGKNFSRYVNKQPHLQHTYL